MNLRIKDGAKIGNSRGPNCGRSDVEVPNSEKHFTNPWGECRTSNFDGAKVQHSQYLRLKI